MGPLHAIRNQYPGINAHLHSYWQGRCGWSRFHTNHIADLLRALRPALLPRGYDADIEPSLQIRRLDDAEPPRFPESDLTIDDRDHECAARPGGQSSASVAELVTPLAEGLFGAPLSANDYGALKIYETVPGRLDRGEPIARIELLSPSNKPGGRDAREYFDKRLSVVGAPTTPPARHTAFSASSHLAAAGVARFGCGWFAAVPRCRVRFTKQKGASARR